MRVRLLRNMVPPEKVWLKGRVVDLDDDLAINWIAREAAERVYGGVETASVMPPEHAVRKRGRPRKVGA